MERITIPIELRTEVIRHEQLKSIANHQQKWFLVCDGSLCSFNVLHHVRICVYNFILNFWREHREPENAKEDTVIIVWGLTFLDELYLRVWVPCLAFPECWLPIIGYLTTGNLRHSQWSKTQTSFVFVCLLFFRKKLISLNSAFFSHKAFMTSFYIENSFMDMNSRLT